MAVTMPVKHDASVANLISMFVMGCVIIKYEDDGMLRDEMQVTGWPPQVYKRGLRMQWTFGHLIFRILVFNSVWYDQMLCISLRTSLFNTKNECLKICPWDRRWRMCSYAS